MLSLCLSLKHCYRHCIIYQLDSRKKMVDIREKFPLNLLSSFELTFSSDILIDKLLFHSSIVRREMPYTRENRWGMIRSLLENGR